MYKVLFVFKIFLRFNFCIITTFCLCLDIEDTQLSVCIKKEEDKFKEKKFPTAIIINDDSEDEHDFVMYVMLNNS